MRKILSTIITPLLLLSLVAQASNEKVSRSKDINDWEDIVVEKGFILSNDLYYSRLCAKIWSHQIPEFKKKNPQVKDVNKFWPGDKITIQTCQAVAAEKAKAKSVKSKDKKSKKPVKPAVQEEVADIDGDASGSMTPSVDQSSLLSSNSKTESTGEDMDIFLGLGFLSERYQDQLYTSPALRLGIKKDLYSFVRYKLTLDAGQSAIFAANKLQFKINSGTKQYYISGGVGNRLGLVKRPENKMSDVFSSYSLVGAGIMFNTKKIDFDIELGTTLNSKPGLNISVTGVKKITDTLSLGAYFDLLSTDSQISETKDSRGLITGGIIVLF